MSRLALAQKIISDLLANTTLKRKLLKLKRKAMNLVVDVEFGTIPAG